MDIAYIFAGLGVGFLVGLTGVGGGSLMTPLLVFLFGFKPTVAVGTDLLFAAITKTGGVWIHHGNHRSVEWKIVGLLSLGSLPSAVITILVLRHLSAIGHETSHLITFSLGAALLLTALALLFRSIVQKKGREVEDHAPGRFHHLQAPATVLVGVIIGSLVTLSSVGAGVLGTVALLYLYPRMSTLRVVGTDLAHAIPLTAVAGFGHLTMGHVDFVLLGSLLIGSLPGIWMGSHLSAKVPEHVLRTILAAVLLLIGFKFVMQ